ncbi:MAG: hypothetical protein D6808_06395 [Candidatus Dadabacteria bacterium]|nr:MAG: hypothetical protein D6808_06395 [Candidatus Dadabacteria bacterium]
MRGEEMEAIREKVDEIALLIVMMRHDDQEGIDMIMGLIDELFEIASKDSKHAKLVDAIKELKSKREVLDSEAFFNFLNDFFSAAQVYCNDPESAVFPSNAEGSASSGNGSDIAPDADPNFLRDFVEEHSSRLDDFESAVVEYDLKEDAGDEDKAKIEQFVKSYLHNIKGDAGSVGLAGISEATHILEDMVGEFSVAPLSGLLREYVKWVKGCIKDISDQNPISEPSETFIRTLRARAEELRANSHKEDPSAEEKTDGDIDSEDKKETKSESESTDAQISSQNSSTQDREPYFIEGEPDILMEFLTEAEEHLSYIEEILLAEPEELDREAIDSIFRGVHSIKGGAAYFGLKDVTETSHITETLMDMVREEKVGFISGIREKLMEYTGLQKELFAQIREAAKGDGKLERSEDALRLYGEIGDFISAINLTESLGDLGEQKQDKAPGSKKVEKAQTSGAEERKEEESKAAKKPQEQGKKNKKLDVRSYVKVDTERLDKLIDSIGEMVIYSSMLTRTCKDLLKDNEFVMNTCHQVEKFSRDLQDIGVSMRLVPIKGLFQKMSRVVWDTSKKVGKEISFYMDGEDTELDRTLIDKLADPLMHMVRNSVDHGIELPEERESIGKQRVGRIELKAFHSGGSIYIQIIDDGRGIDPEKIYAKAVEKGIVSDEQKLSEQEIYQLLFAPGFSTAEKVTDISGRGVGMDVVRKNIESIRGHIHVESEIGKGTTFTIEVPLTLAIIDGIEVKVGAERFIIPTLSIIEFMSPSPDMVTRTLDKAETFHFRDLYLPVYRLHELFDIETECLRPEDSVFVVVECNGEQVAIMVDAIVDQHQTVIKGIGDIFGDDKGIAGCAIMSNGHAALILDVRSLVQIARKEYHPDLDRIYAQTEIIEVDGSASTDIEPIEVQDSPSLKPEGNTVIH